MVKTYIDPIMAIDIPDDWELVPLGECVKEKLSYGVNAPAVPYNNNYPCYIRITDITEEGQYNDSDKKSVITNEAEKYILKQGDIVLARTGASTGKSYMYNEKDGKLVYAGFLIRAGVDTDKHNPRYIVAQLRTKRYWNWVSATSMRSGQPGINGKEYASFLLPIAPKPEQDKVADILNSLDVYIDDLAELIEKKKGIRDGAINDLLSGKTRLKGFGSPWKESTLGTEFDVIMGSSPNSASYNSARIGVPLVQGNADIENRVTAPKRYTSMPTKICEIGDTILTVRAPVGSASRANQRVCLGRGVCAISGSHKDFIYYLMRYHESAWESIEQGSTFTAVSGKEVRKFEIKIPEEGKEQDSIASILKSMDEEIRDLETERNKIIQIREGAMDDLLTGRVRLTK